MDEDLPDIHFCAGGRCPRPADRNTSPYCKTCEIEALKSTDPHHERFLHAISIITQIIEVNDTALDCQYSGNDCWQHAYDLILELHEELSLQFRADDRLDIGWLNNALRSKDDILAYIEPIKKLKTDLEEEIEKTSSYRF